MSDSASISIGAFSFLNDLRFYEGRLKTFINWPYDEKCKCNVERMAKSGLFHPANAEDDVAQCFVCFKELEGWEPDDDPHTEHASHSPKCPYLSSVPYEQMTAREGLEMDVLRYTNYLQWFKEQTLRSVKDKLRERLITIRDELAPRFVRRRQRSKQTMNNRSPTVSEVSMCSTRSLRSTRSKR